jgi:transketolase
VRSTAIKTLADAASGGADIHLFTADLGFKVLDPFRDAHPHRFTNVGVAEANMVGIAAGMALSGKRPVCYSMVPFLFMRAFEQVRLDVVAARLPVVLIGVGGGLSYGSEGMSHHAIEDLAMARSLPGLRVIAPGDPHETVAAVKLALREAGPTFIRLGKNGDPHLHPGPLSDLSRPVTLHGEGSHIVLLATGHILGAAVAACKRLTSRGIQVRLVSVPMIKPFDHGFIRRIASDAESIFTLEEHSVIGGLGSQVAEILLEERYTKRFLKLGLPDVYCTTHGTLDWLRTQYGLDPEGIAKRIVEHLA